MARGVQVPGGGHRGQPFHDDRDQRPGRGGAELQRDERATSLQAVFCDYSPFTVLEFRDWITHEGLYAPGGRYDGDGWAGGGAKYQGAAGLTQFNTDFGTSFTTWDLEVLQLVARRPVRCRTTPTRSTRTRTASRSALYVHGGMMPADGAGFTPGGFDPPRVMLAKGTDPFWDLWQTFRETLVYHHVRDIIAIADAEGIPADRLFTHQIPGDYLCGTYPDYPSGNNNRYYSSGSPLWTADMGALSGLGVTCYDLHFPDWLGADVAVAARRADGALDQLGADGVQPGSDPGRVRRPGHHRPGRRHLRPDDAGLPAGVHFLNFFLWRGPIEWAYEGTPREDALDMMFAAVKDTRPPARGDDLHAAGSGRRGGVVRSRGDRVVVSWSPLIWPDLSYRWDQWGDFGGVHGVPRHDRGLPMRPWRPQSAGRQLLEWADTTFDRSRPVYYKVVATNSLGEEGPVAATGRILPREGPVAVLGLGRSALVFGATGSAVTHQPPGPHDRELRHGRPQLGDPGRAAGRHLVRPTVSSGTNTSVVPIGVAPGLAPGTYTASLVVEDPAALCSPQTVGDHVHGAPGREPAVWRTLTRRQTVRRGWSGRCRSRGGRWTTSRSRGWILWRDPFGSEPPTNPNGLVYIGEATIVAGQRPDVEAAYPAMPMAYRAGWGYSLLTNLLPTGGNGSVPGARLRVRRGRAPDAPGGDGGSRRATRRRRSRLGRSTRRRRGRRSRGWVRVWGWALTPQPGVIPVDGSTITVYIDGVAVGHPRQRVPEA